MSRANSKRSGKDYPSSTHGSKVAERGRQKANKLTEAQREEYFRKGMVLIYGSGIPKRLSLDTYILFDLADEQDFAHDFRETYQAKGYSMVICPTVVAELYFFHEHGADEEQRLASLALSQIAAWDIQIFPLTSVQLEIARKFSAMVISRGLLPDSEVNDARLLGESAVSGIPLVVTSDHHLLDIDADVMRDVCAEADLSPALPVSPRRLVRAAS